jgi:outer membrane biosynthesis protein TonB
MMIAVIAFALCGGPELLQAQQSQSDGLTTLASTTPLQQEATTAAPATSDQANPQPSAQQSQAQTAQPQDQNLGTTQQNATPDPSKGPLQPAETNAPPNAPAPAPANQQQSQEQQPAQAPAGTAAAQGVKTAGGAASRPAGTAIAPAKQHQTRSLLIKLGAVAAGAVALGTVYGLSRSSSSTPSGTHTAATGAVGH